MGFIKHALIGIVLYEAVKYIIKKENCGFDFAAEGGEILPADDQRWVREEADVIAGARQTDSDDDLIAGTDPEAPLTSKRSDIDDPWQKSLANDELRAPDS